MTGKIFALLVGIDRYANIEQVPPLRGCVADALGTEHILRSHFDVATEQIRLLTARLDGGEAPKQLATRANIIRGWREHLAQAGPGDHAFFAYSGHGSQSRSIHPSEPDGFDETIVPFDSRTPGVYDLLDKELAALIEEVERRGAQVSVLLDSCHSGSGTRQGISDERPRVRRCRPDKRLRSPDTVLVGEHGFPAAAKSRTPSGWLPLGNHILLAGCREDELSNEYLVPETGQWQGAATYFFHKALAGRRPGTTWADVHEFVQTQVHALYASQCPQLEGPGHLEVFGGPTVNVDQYLLVSDVAGSDSRGSDGRPSSKDHPALVTHIKVNGGAAVGLGPGSRLAIYAPGQSQPTTSIATAVVETAQVDSAWAKLECPTSIPLASRVRIISGTIQHVQTVEIEDEWVRAAVATLADGAPSPYLRVIGPASSQDEDSQARSNVGSGDNGPTCVMPELVVTADEGQYAITDAAGSRVVPQTFPATLEGAGKVAAALEHVAMYRNIHRLHNPVAYGKLHGAIAIDIVTYTEMVGDRPRDPRPLRTEGNVSMVHVGDKIWVRIENRSARPVYLAALNLDDDFGIRRIYPVRAGYQKVAPGAHVDIPGIRAQISDVDCAYAVETIKVFATTSPTSFDVLQMPKLLGTDEPRFRLPSKEDMPLPKDLLVERSGLEPVDQWTTAQIDLTVVADSRTHRLRTGDTRIVVAGQPALSIAKPAEFDGALKVGSLLAARTGENQPYVDLPPGLRSPAAQDSFRPVCLPGGQRATGESPLVLELQADTDVMAAICPQRPLEFSVTLADERGLGGILVVAHDGEYYYAVGRPSGDEVLPDGRRRLVSTIDYLPAAREKAPARGDDATVVRDMRQTVRLFLFKIFHGKLPDDAGLRRAELEDGVVVHRPVSRHDMVGVKRVALLLHGFTGDTRWMVEGLWGWAKAAGRYDLCLTYDYETLGTGIRSTAERLIDRLAELGFGAEDSFHLDIYGHSMGSQVARAVVELYYGDEYVDRVFMAGPPNAGSLLARARVLLPWLVNVALNITGSMPPALVAHWLMDRFAQSARGIADLDPESRFYRDLNHPRRRPVNVPYYVQIGDNSASYQDWMRMSHRLNQVLDQGLDALFAGDNDLVVAVESALFLRTQWPEFRYEILPVNHFQYYHSESGRSVLKTWLQDE